MFKKTMMAAFVSLALQANAADTAVEVGMSTLGAGITGSYRLMDSMVLRGQYNYFTFGTDFEEDEIEYDADLELSSFGVMADWYMFDNSGFRLTAGAYYNGNALEGEGKPKNGNNFEIGGTPYALDRLDADVEFNSFAPYLGMGWTSGSAGTAGFIFSADLGVLYQGSGDVSLKASGAATGLPGFNEDLKEEEQKLEDELSGYKVYPVASISMGYRF
ncbi:hypothetical protein [Endozoicomonas sp. GU-1]|uniref:hypothetical protein n=1 Tax=Endozoicomonas sp. GU-1 TaxID=3009078 RepID=UPI0022B463EF|nr:hypothetical protein [Endozoicomonas sp. GU-1]WBA80888.1 hypothetical protein O2T12_21685 [Endozoicomonas sp. GU-1]WBA88452.1 hypothetical protein O3276_10875 [Endozoicomonas sp. GU-1]